MPLFTPEELEEIRKADEEIEAEFFLTDEDRARSRRLEYEAVLDRMDNRTRKNTISKAKRDAEYRKARRAEILSRKAAYYKAHKEEIAAKKAAYRKAHRDEIRTYKNDYR